MTLTVSPENLGPVTVRAHVSAEGIRVELFVPTELARESLRALLPDLRRDLAGAGMNADLDLSSESQAGEPQSERPNRQAADARTLRGVSPDTPTFTPRGPLTGSASTIDVLA